MKQIVSIFLLVISANSFAQTTVNVNLNHLYEGNSFALNEVISTADYDFKITRFQYYLSNFSIIHDGGSEAIIDDSYLLINAENNAYTLNDFTGVANVEKIKFHFGVDEVANHDDPAQYASSHALAYQSPSMHWGWSGGYMFAVVEGVVDLNKDGNFDIFFDFMPVQDKYYTELNMVVDDVISSGAITFNIDVRIDNWISGFDLSTIGINHGINTNLGSFSDVVTRQVFYTEGTVDVAYKTHNVGFEILNNGKSPEIVTDFSSKAFKLELFDMSGKLINIIPISTQPIKLTNYTTTKGTYVLTLKDSQDKIVQTKKILLNH